MSWIRKQLDQLLAEGRRRSKWVTVGAVAALAAVLVVTVALTRGATAASTTGVGDAEQGQTPIQVAADAPVSNDAGGNPDRGRLTSAKFSTERSGGGTDPVTGAVAAGSRVQFELTFAANPGELSTTDNTITYVLPEGIETDSSQLTDRNIAGEGQQAGKSLGSWDIVKDEDGTTKVVMTFNEEQVQNLFSQGFTTKLTFWATAQNSSVTESKTYDFNGVGTLVVNPTDATISVSKAVQKQTDDSGADLADGDGNRNRHASYTITVGSTVGTGKPVTITDQFVTGGSTNVQSASYDSGTFSVKKYASASDQTGVAVDYSADQLAIDNNGFVLSNLPALAAGERYVLAYNATVTETDHTADTNARNNVEAKVDDNTKSTGYATAQWSNHGDIHLSKTGQLLNDVVDQNDPNKKRIRYTLKVWSDRGTVTRIQIGDSAYREDTKNLDTSRWTTSLAPNEFFEHDSFTLTRYRSTADADSGTNGIDDSQYLRDTSFGQDNGKPSMGVAISRPLEAGECYILTYTAVVRMQDINAPDTRVNNQAIARIYPGGKESNTGQVHTPIEWHNDIQKSGTYNEDTGYIDWTINVNRNNADPNGLVMEDTLPDGLRLVSNVRISGGNVNRTLDLLAGEQDGSSYDASTRKLTVRLGDWATQRTTYAIKFSTTAPADGTVSNQAFETKNGSTYGSQGVGPGTITRRTDWGIGKTSAGSNFDASTGLYTLKWNSTVTFPYQDLTPDGDNGVIRLHDHIDDLTSNGTSSSEYAGLHYAVARDLYADLTGTGSATVTLSLHNDADPNGQARVYTLGANGFTWSSGDDSATLDGVRLEFVFYDASGAVIDNPADSDVHVKTFDVVLTCDAGKTINGRSLTINGYRTVVDGSKLPAGTQFDVQNSLSSNRTQSASTQSQSIQTMSNPLEKQVRTLDNRSDNDNNGFAAKEKFEADWNSTISGDYSALSNGQHAVQYRIALNTTDYPDGTVTITDTLPAGMKLATSVKDKNNGDVTHPVRLVWGENIGLSSAKYTTINDVLGYTTAQDGDHQVITFTFDPSQTNKGKGQYYITYTASYLDDPAWNSLGTGNRTYDNTVTATVGGRSYTDSARLNVTRTVNNVTKTVDGEILNDRKVRYRVVINPGAADLAPNSDTVQLTDELTATGSNGWNNANTTRGHMNPELDLTSVHVYLYNPNASNGLGTELDKARYSLTYTHTDGDDGQRKITLTVPDSMALVFVYTYQFNAGTSGDWGSTSGSDMTATIGNTATLAGQSSGEVRAAARRSASGATGSTLGLYLYKVDAANNARTLGGSEFSIYEYGPSDEAGQWVKKTDVDGGTVDSGGYHPRFIPLLGDNVSVDHNKLYKFVETQAPAGYDKTVKYIVWLNDGQSTDDAWKSITGSEDASADAQIADVDASGTTIGDSISRSAVTFVPYQGGNLYIEDTYQSIKVTKTWSGSDGSTLQASDPDIPSSVKVRLERTQVAHGATQADADAKWETVKEDELSKDHGSSYDFTNGSTSQSSSDDDKWTFTWEHLPADNGQTGDAQRDYLYRVVEVDDSGNWKATYLNNGGIRTGNITVNNVRQYSLPSTGGIPLNTLVTFGVALAAASGILLAIRRVAARR